MIRTQISLTEQQMAELRDIAHRRQTSMAAIVREAVDATLADDARQSRLRRALEAVTGISDGSGHRDVARDHDQHLAEAFNG